MRYVAIAVALAFLTVGCAVEEDDHDRAVDTRQAALEPLDEAAPEEGASGDHADENEAGAFDAGAEEGNPEPTPWDPGLVEGNPEPTPWDPGGDEASNPEPTPWEPGRDERTSNPEPTPWRQDGEPDDEEVESAEGLVATAAANPWDRW